MNKASGVASIFPSVIFSGRAIAEVWRPLYNADIFVEIDAIKIIDNNEYQ